MLDKKGQALAPRRRFLKGLAAGGGAAVVGLGARSVSAEAADEQQQTREKGYRESQHISDYYRTTKI